MSSKGIADAGPVRSRRSYLPHDRTFRGFASHPGSFFHEDCEVATGQAASIQRKMGFREIQHTADWAIRVWAGDLPSLFSEAARGMNSLAGAEIGPGKRLRRRIDLIEADAEGLLVAFLSDLVYAQEQENMGFDEFHLQVSSTQLWGLMEGATLQSLTKPIKAVTYHNLKIARTPRGCQVELVFDV